MRDGRRDYTAETKVCTKCGETKPLSEYSHKRPTGRKPGLQPRCKSCAVEDTREWYRKNKDKAKNSRLVSAYGITLQEYEGVIAKQNNRCLICGVKFKTKKVGPDSPVVDHCHSTGRVRGILCNECNRGLGYFRDSPQALRQAANYLEEN